MRQIHDADAVGIQSRPRGSRTALALLLGAATASVAGCTIVSHHDQNDASPTVVSDAGGVSADATPEAPGPTASECATHAACGDCASNKGCVWCGASKQCISLTGTKGHSCKGDLAAKPSACGSSGGTGESAASDDPCSPYTGLQTLIDISTCTKAADCGWCNGQCVSGTESAMTPTTSTPYCSKWRWSVPPLGIDIRSVMRDACLYAPGAQADDTIEGMDAARANIKFLVVVMQENHSMDNMFGQTRIAGIDALPSAWLTGLGTYPAYPLRSSCTTDPGHQWGEMHTYWNNGAMDGFFNYQQAMGYYLDDDHPFYTSLADTFATSDSYFASALGGTWANRDFFITGTSDGVKSTGVGYVKATTPTIWDRLSAKGVNWAYVARNQAVDPGLGNWIEEGALGYRLSPSDPHVMSYADLLTKIDNARPDAPWGDYPQVVFVEGGEPYDEHPTNSIHKGERYVAELINHGIANRDFWRHAAIMVTYDEGGGYLDHVAPPNACAPDPTQAEFNYLGFRVPFFLASAFSKKHYVSHVTHSHTSILRFIEGLYGIEALTYRDANSDALLDMFDFTTNDGVGAFFDNTAISLAAPWPDESCSVTTP